MQIMPVRNLPRPVKEEITRQPQRGEFPPGFLIGIDDVLAQYPSLHATMSKIKDENGLLGHPCLVVTPEHTLSIFAYEKELDLLKTIASQAAAQIDANFKYGIDVLWFLFKAARLRDEWTRPDRDTVACLFQVAGMGLSLAGLVGSAYPDLKAPDHWLNGINFIVKSGGALYEGRTLPINEMVLSRDKRLAIPLKLLTVAGVALDPRPEFQSFTALPLPGMTKR